MWCFRNEKSSVFTLSLAGRSAMNPDPHQQKCKVVRMALHKLQGRMKVRKKEREWQARCHKVQQINLLSSDGSGSRTVSFTGV